jgi:hypothetical protein
MPRILLILPVAVRPGACGAAISAPGESGDPLDAHLWIPPELRQALQREVVAPTEPGQDRLDRLLTRMDSLETATARRRMEMVSAAGQDGRPGPGAALHLNGAVPAA